MMWSALRKPGCAIPALLVKRVELSYVGDSISYFFKQDSIMAFNIAMKELALRYDQRKRPDIVIKSHGYSGTPLKSEVLIIRFQGSIYFMALIPNSTETTYQPKQIMSFLNEKILDHLQF
jgi:hypothetical protein